MNLRPPTARAPWLVGAVVATVVLAAGLVGFGPPGAPPSQPGQEDPGASVQSDGERLGQGDPEATQPATDAAGDAVARDHLDAVSEEADGADDVADGEESDEQPPAAEPTAREAEPVGDPQRIEIPAIGVDSAIVPVGLEPDGAMEVPDFGLSGWYTEGPRPGEEGPATVVAHVDSRAGPDVFARLDELGEGDEVRIHGDDGTVTFVVEGRERAPKDALPEERIWGWTPEPALRLITCDGLFDQSTGHYEDNLIVYLSLADG